MNTETTRPDETLEDIAAEITAEMELRREQCWPMATAIHEFQRKLREAKQ